MTPRLQIVAIVACIALAATATNTLARDAADTDQSTRPSKVSPAKEAPKPNSRPVTSGKSEGLSAPGTSGSRERESGDPKALVNPCQGKPMPNWCNQ
jgi:hypothetical protein